MPSTRSTASKSLFIVTIGELKETFVHFKKREKPEAALQEPRREPIFPTILSLGELFRQHFCSFFYSASEISYIVLYMPRKKKTEKSRAENRRKDFQLEFNWVSMRLELGRKKLLISPPAQTVTTGSSCHTNGLDALIVFRESRIFRPERR